MNLPKTFVCYLIILTSLVSSKPFRRTEVCEYYNPSACENRGRSCSRVEHCKHEIRNHCYTIWKLNSLGEHIPQLKGCFTNNIECYDKYECVETSPKSLGHVFFCCCEGDMCNRNFKWVPVPTPTVNITTTVEPTPEPSYDIITPIIFLCFGLVLAFSVGFLVWYLKFRNTKPALRSTELVEIIALGKFGPVWKGLYKTRTVAVKVFPLQDKQSWITEKEVYELPFMNNPDILEFIGVESRGDDLLEEFWLVTAYHEKGSLYDYLKSNVISWLELGKIAQCIARGLMFLHTQKSENRGKTIKPIIAHRDIKSKNVLLKSDMSACIADFGLALIFYPDQSCEETHTHIGTRRYMAPEVLDGGADFTVDGFLSIDMYAFGLVLWELVSRCTAQQGPVPEYSLPYEEEVGQMPSLKDMKECVVDKKKRPNIKDGWRQHPGLFVFCNTIRECLDENPQARVTAASVVERISIIYSENEDIF